MGQILQEDIKILDTHAPNNRESKDMRQKLIELQRNIDESIIIVEDLNTPLSVTYRYSKQNISKTTTELNSTTNQFNIIDIYIEYKCLYSIF